MTIRLEIVPEAGSTNSELLARLAGGELIGEGHWLIADRQVQGRGRQSRRWIDGQGNFMGSTVIRLAPHDPPPASLSFVAALAAYEALSGSMADPRLLQLKWPNDILLGGAKLCGILLEREGDNAIVGIGVNLAQAPAVDGRATASLAQVGALPDRDTFARRLADTFALELQRWRQFGAEPLLRRWQAVAHPVGTPLAVHDQSGEMISGTFAGLAIDGAMRLRLEDGAEHVIHAGDVMLEAR